MMHRGLVLALAALPSSMAVTWPVQVGANGLTYDPPTVNAAVDDYVVFTFAAKNHTATQSSFAAPCVPLDGGLNSGFQPVTNTSNLPTFQVHVLDTNPKWFFCEQTNPVGHCGQGMVFAINAPADPDPHSFSAFQALAKSLNGTSTNGTTTTPPSTTTAPPDTYSTPPPQSWALTTAVVSSGASTWTTTYTSYDGTPSPTFAPTPQDHKIVVGVNVTQLIYSPANISAAIGDTVTFEFHAKNHTATQSSFSAPCVPLQDSTGKPGFKSGFQSVDPSLTSGFPTFTITINDTAPIWGYCGQTNPVSHCGQGMVFAINAVETGANNFAAFQALAEHINGTGSTGGSGTSGAPATTSTKPSSALGNARVNVAAVFISLFAGVAYFL